MLIQVKNEFFYNIRSCGGWYFSLCRRGSGFLRHCHRMTYLILFKYE